MQKDRPIGKGGRVRMGKVCDVRSHEQSAFDITMVLIWLNQRMFVWIMFALNLFPLWQCNHWFPSTDTTISNWFEWIFILNIFFSLALSFCLRINSMNMVWFLVYCFSASVNQTAKKNNEEITIRITLDEAINQTIWFNFFFRSHFLLSAPIFVRATKKIRALRQSQSKKALENLHIKYWLHTIRNCLLSDTYQWQMVRFAQI